MRPRECLVVCLWWPTWSQVFTLDMYRALDSTMQDYKIENQNLADLSGALKYVHTEILPESVINDDTRPTRRYGIDVIMKRRFKVRNNLGLLDSQWRREPGFGPFVAFDWGQATERDLWDVFTTYGPWFGVQAQRDPRYLMDQASFWFSVAGGCPNLPFQSVPSQICREDFPDLFPDMCPAKCAVEGEAGCKEMSEHCLKVDGEILQGGLCEGGGGDAHWPECAEDGESCRSSLCCRRVGSHCWQKNSHTAVCKPHCHAGQIDVEEALGEQTPWDCDLLSFPMHPTGKRDCVYSYSDADTVNLDSLAGISSVDCGGRPCKDWFDFRTKCTVSDYKRMFAPDGEIRPVEFCVEYDVHPDCRDRCGPLFPEDRLGHDCQYLLEQSRADPAVVVELGLPFWRGRCDKQANLNRAEAVADSFGIVGAGTSHNVVDGVILGLHEPCIIEGLGECIPNPSTGDNYCDRSFSGVCSRCSIPGTHLGQKGSHSGICSLAVLNTVDYKDVTYKPICASQVPSDLCCLYTRECTGSSDPTSAVLNDEGFMLVASQLNNKHVVDFLTRSALHHHYTGVADPDGLARKAYTEWSRQPIYRKLEDILADIHEFMIPMPTTTSPIPAAAATLPRTVPTQSSGLPFFFSFVAVCTLILGGSWFLRRRIEADMARRGADPQATELTSVA